jgi:hypothetical protein
MVRRYNPSLSQEPRNHNQLIPILPPIAKESLLDWLQRTGRLKSPDVDLLPDLEVPEELDDILDPEAYREDHEEEHGNEED